jgi:hypothetical protein
LSATVLHYRIESRAPGSRAWTEWKQVLPSEVGSFSVGPMLEALPELCRDHDFRLVRVTDVGEVIVFEACKPRQFH